MIFKSILSLKNKNKFKLISCLIVLTIILSLSGCATTETQRVKSENMYYKMNYKIMNVIMKNGHIIDLEDKSALYFREYNSKRNVIVYTTTDSVRISKDSLNLFPITKIIEIDNVHKVTIEKRGNVSATPFIIIGVAAILIAFLAKPGGLSVGP